MKRSAKAGVEPRRQRTQYSCMSASMCMALRALGCVCNEDEVNKVMGARPMQGASWEQALACGQHFGMRCTLTTPATISQLKSWTDAGNPVMIAWNPEGRPWSHASLVFDVEDDGTVHVADPNCPDPEQTVRIVPKSEFYQKWFEKWPDYLVRRPAMAVEREIDADGRQLVASQQKKKSSDLMENYIQSVANLETSVDHFASLTNELRSMGITASDADYPFSQDAEALAADVSRWRRSLDRSNPLLNVRLANRVAQKFLENK